MTTITPDKAALIAKAIQTTYVSLTEILRITQVDTVDPDYAKTLLSVVENNMAAISKHLAIATQTQSDIDERHAKMRSANLRIRELERQMGEACPIDFLAKSIGVLDCQFRHWWRTFGFGHVNKFSLKEFGAKISLSASLYGRRSSLFSATPVSDKENQVLWLNSLVSQGYSITGLANQKDKELIDCDKNRELIGNLIADRFPSARIISITNYCNQDNIAIVIDIKILIRDIREIHQLAVLKADE